MRFSHSIQRGYVAVMFDGKPSERVRLILKGSGFRWSPSAGGWSITGSDGVTWSPAGHWWRSRVAGAADVVAAVRLQLDRESGVRRPDGACWRCKSPDGFFRPHGAATPVYCDACHAEHQRQAAVPDRSDMDYENQCRSACGL